MDRFWSKVDKSSNCWNWTAGKSRGYGYINIDGKNIQAHRFSWEYYNGKIPETSGYHGTCVLHHCDNPSCVNPKHLFLGSQRKNMDDMLTKCRQAKGDKISLSKLTEVDVKEIRDHFDCGVFTQQEIADYYSVAVSTINKVINYKTWTHI